MSRKARSQRTSRWPPEIARRRLWTDSTRTLIRRVSRESIVSAIEEGVTRAEGSRTALAALLRFLVVVLVFGLVGGLILLHRLPSDFQFRTSELSPPGDLTIADSDTLGLFAIRGATRALRVRLLEDTALRIRLPLPRSCQGLAFGFDGAECAAGTLRLTQPSPVDVEWSGQARVTATWTAVSSVRMDFNVADRGDPPKVLMTVRGARELTLCFTSPAQGTVSVYLAGRALAAWSVDPEARPVQCDQSLEIYVPSFSSNVAARAVLSLDQGDLAVLLRGRSGEFSIGPSTVRVGAAERLVTRGEPLTVSSVSPLCALLTVGLGELRKPSEVDPQCTEVEPDLTLGTEQLKIASSSVVTVASRSGELVPTIFETYSAIGLTLISGYLAFLGAVMLNLVRVLVAREQLR